MPSIFPPSSDSSRLAFLKQAAKRGEQDRLNGNEYISQGTLAAVVAFVPLFERGITEVAARQRGRGREIRGSHEALARLSMYVRDLWEGLRRRVRRLGEPASVLEFYGLPLSGTNPKPRTPTEWLGLATKVIAGDAAAVAAGYEPMVNPAVTEIEAVLEGAQKEVAEVAPAERAYRAAQVALAALRPRADDLIRDVLDELRFHLRKEPTANQRRIMRTYGVRYRYLPRETREPDESSDDYLE